MKIKVEVKHACQPDHEWTRSSVHGTGTAIFGVDTKQKGLVRSSRRLGKGANTNPGISASCGPSRSVHMIAAE